MSFMRELGKYMEPCLECGSTHWQAQKKQVKMGVTYRYRLCLDCGYKVRTKQLPGEEETFYAECKQSGPMKKTEFIPTEHGLSHFMVELNSRNEAPVKENKINIKLNDTRNKQKIGIMNHTTNEISFAEWSFEDSLASFDDNWAKITGGN